MKRFLGLVTATVMVTASLIMPAQAAFDESAAVYDAENLKNGYIVSAKSNVGKFTNSTETSINLNNDAPVITYGNPETIGVFVADAQIVGDETNGYTFSMDADEYTSPALKYGNFVLNLPKMYDGQRLRADSVKFQVPEKIAGASDEDYAKGFIRLFDSSNDNTNGYVYGSAENGLKIMNGDALVTDLDKSTTKWSQKINGKNTLTPGTWYRAERILDVRIENKNMQRFVIYSLNDDGSDNAVVADSGWVWTSKHSLTNEKGGTGNAYTDTKNYPFRGTGVGAWAYPSGTTFLFDELKGWNLGETIPETFTADDAEVNNKYVKWPVGKTATTSKAKHFGFPILWNYNRSAGDNYGKAEKDVNNTKMYYSMDFMLPELNTADMTLLEIVTNVLYPDNDTDNATGPIQLAAGGKITVTKWDKASGEYTDKVNAADTENEFALQLEAGKWYNVKHIITLDKTAETDEDGNPTGTVTENGATAVTIITDENGNEYKTESYDFKSLSVRQGLSLASVKAIDGQKAINGANINIDNVKFICSPDEETAENAITIVNEDFETRSIGGDFYDIAMEDMWPSNTNIVGFAKFGMIESDRKVAINGVPSQFAIKFADKMNKSALESGAVKLYKGENDVTEHFTPSYDETSKTLTVRGTFLPSTAYTLKISRDAATPADTVLSALPGGDGSELVYTITTGAEVQKDIEISASFKSNNEYLVGSALTANQTIDFDIYYTNPNTSIDVPFVLAAAAYSADGKLEDIKSAKGTFEANGMYQQVNVGSVTTKTDGGYVKIFVWDSWGNMMPIANMTVYPAQN